ncbi:MAG: hypothetical protein JKY33_07365 [Bacteroidia bacterium]|nr:hypothetical protein [Bacteroidia bacterium]
MKKLITSLSILVFVSLYTYSQNDVDALRYSQTEFGGTARSVATAGAFGALGGDYGSLSINPAGIGVYRKSEFTFTPSMYTSLTNSRYQGRNYFESKYNFNFSNIGVVITYLYKDHKEAKEGDNKSGWVSSNIGFGINRVKNFHNRSYFEGLNTDNSIIDKYVQEANAGTGILLDDLEDTSPFRADLAYATYLMDPTDSLGGTYFRAFSLGDGILQRKEIVRSGAINDFAFTMGGNYSNKLYVGASFNFPIVRYSENTVFEEEATGIDTTNFTSFRINESLSTEGQGFNFKFGLIARLADWVRIGGSVQTPTFYDLTDRYDSRIVSNIYNKKYEKSSPNGKFDYQLTTPLKANTSIAFIIGKKGFLSVDYEVVDYSTSRLRSSGYKFFDENESIYNKYHQTGNLRIGTEWKFDKISVRGGYALYGTPFHTAYLPDDGGDQSKTFYTLGLGLREDGYYIDLAYVYAESSSYHVPYTLTGQSTSGSVNKSTDHNIMMTVGCRF